MTKRFLLAFTLAAGVYAGLPNAAVRAQQAPAVDPKAVLATLKDLRTKQTGIITQEKNGVLAAINAAIADPGKAYEQALAAVEQQTPGNEPAPNLSPRPGINRPPSAAREINRTAELRKRENDLLRDRDFINGLRLQLVYLSLTWQRSMGVPSRNLLSSLIEYTGQVTNANESLAPLEMYKKSLGESPFVPYFQVGPYINGLADWSDHPFDVDSIYQKTILPEMRKTRDPRLLDYWDGRLQLETARASASGNNLTISKFNHIRRPSLLWGRAEDEGLLGNGNQSVADMLAVLKTNPDHPDFDKWASQLEGIVSAKTDPPAGDVTVGPASPATLVTPTPGILATPAASGAR